MKLVLPDTNILILALSNQKPYSSFLSSWIIDKQLIFSSVVVAEFLSGATDEEEKVFLSLLKPFPIIPVDLTVAQLGAYYRKKYLTQKTKLMLPDCLIAASCKVTKAALATADPKDFPIKEIEVLHLDSKVT